MIEYVIIIQLIWFSVLAFILIRNATAESDLKIGDIDPTIYAAAVACLFPGMGIGVCICITIYLIVEWLQSKNVGEWIIARKRK